MQSEISRKWIMQVGENVPWISLHIIFRWFLRDRILFPARIHMPDGAMLTRTEVMTVTEYRWGIHLSNHHCLPLSTTHRLGAERVNQRNVRILDKWRGQKETGELFTASTATVCPSCQGNYWQLLANFVNFPLRRRLLSLQNPVYVNSLCRLLNASKHHPPTLCNALPPCPHRLLASISSISRTSREKITTGTAALDDDRTYLILRSS